MKYLTALLLLFPLIAGAQTTLVRSCPTQPTTNTFGACTNSQWSVPSTQLILDVQRKNVSGDVWVTPSQLIAGDVVFACTDPTITAGPFKTCPSPLPGQTNNYLDATKINFGTTPPAATGQLTWTWQAPTQNADGSPLTDLAGYHLYLRPQSVAAYPAAIVLPTTATSYVSKSISGNYCGEIAAFNAAGTEGVMSDEVCAAASVSVIAPAKVSLTVR